MVYLARWIRPWVTTDGPEALDSMVMEARDRTANLACFAAAIVVWILVGLVVTTRDPVKARQRTRESLQLQIYAMGYEAMTGRLPDTLALHFLESGVVGEVAVDPKRLAKARERIGQAAAGMRARDYTPKPDYIACGYCAFRDICPASIAR